VSAYTVCFLPDDIKVRAREGATIAEAAGQAGVDITLTCGGRGTCGRCVVFVDDKPVKACVTLIKRDMTVYVPEAARVEGQMVLTDVNLYRDWLTANGSTIPRPRARSVRVEIKPSSIDDPRDDFYRLKEALSEKLGINRDMISISRACLRKLPFLIRENDNKLRVSLLYGKDSARVISFSDKPLRGIAIDIGTTTIAAALCDLETGLTLSSAGLANPQARYGLDIISRIAFCEERADGLDLLREAVTGALADITRALSANAGVDPADIPITVIAGNTVMCHLLLGLPCDYLRREPYVPVTREYPELSPTALGLPFLPEGQVLILPGVSSYVGGDIVAGAIATALPEAKGYNILADVGTNGEIVLAGEGFMAACSCSAGPAFEGSGISCGSRAIPAAIDNVYIQNGRLAFDTIGGPGVVPKSLCGSGLISLLSSLSRIGAIDRGGRFIAGWATGFGAGGEKYNLTPDIYVDQADIMNLIRAKAAVYAGLRVLTDSFDIRMADIERISVAGGFGRNINIRDAIDIGMMPALPVEAFRFVGNSSLAGALMVLNDRRIDARETASAIANVELSADNRFMDEFTRACFLPHTDLSAWGL